MRIYGYENIKSDSMIEKQIFKPFQEEIIVTRKIEEKLVDTY